MNRFRSNGQGRARPDPYPRKMSHRGTMRQSSVRALDVLALLGRLGRPARGIEISRGLGVPNSTVDKILKALTEQGHLSFDRATKRYSPTFRVVQTAESIEAAFFGHHLLRRIMGALHEATGHTVGVFVENGCWVQCVAALPGALYDPALHGEGVRATILGSAPGNALMLLKSDAEVLDRARHAAARNVLDPSLHDPRQVIALMRATRERGFATRRVRGVLSVACPVRLAPQVHPQALRLAVAEPSAFEVDEQALGELLCRTVERHLAQAQHDAWGAMRGARPPA